MSKLYQNEQIAFLTLDPVHVGAGGYRLGRVDMTIVREPGTNLPKVPGTSLTGAARSYAAMQYGKIAAAGQQKKLKKRGLDCPILYTFGTSSDDEKTGVSVAGSVSISDARLIFFPVSSASGPVWISTPETLTAAGFQVSGGAPDTNGQVAVTLDNQKGPINLGWLLLPVSGQKAVVEPPNYAGKGAFKDVIKRLALVDPIFFSLIVNNHLEVRTSVAINPETGAAEEKALFTYEAIPRGAWLLSNVVLDNYLQLSRNTFPKVTKQCKIDGEQYFENQGEDLPQPWNDPLDVLRSGLTLIEYLGVGGMGTRGFGRMKMFAEWGDSK